MTETTLDRDTELAGVKEILGFVLHVVGEPVTIQKEALKNGLPEETQINIEDTGDAFVFSLVVPGGQ
jgi:hypothetical protein